MRQTEVGAQSEVASAVERLVHQLVDQPEAVEVTELEDGPVRLLTLRASGKQAGMVIGRKGRLINALRELVGAIAARRGEVIKIEVIAVALLLCVTLAAPAWGQQQTQNAELRTQNSQQAKPPETSAPSASSAPHQTVQGSAVKSEAPAPSPELLKAWEQLQSVVELRQAELRRREQAIEQLTQAQIAISSFSGQAERLAGEFQKLLPAGYRWDAASKSLLKIAPEKP